jgi:hypothetical protein
MYLKQQLVFRSFALTYRPVIIPLKGIGLNPPTPRKWPVAQLKIERIMKKVFHHLKPIYMRIPLLNSLLLLLFLAFGQQLSAQCTPDTEPPAAVCPGSLDVVLSLNQTATLPATALDDGSSDNCTTQLNFFLNDGLPAANLPSTTILDFDADDIGTHDVTLWVVDAAGNQNHCITAVTVKNDCGGGSSTPVMACNDRIIITPANGDSVLVYPGLFLEGYNYCNYYLINTFKIGVGGPPGITGNYFSFDSSDEGLHSIRVSDALTGVSCWSELEVKLPCPIDTVPPNMSCVLSQVINVAIEDVTINANDVVIYNADNCSETLILALESAPASAIPPSATSLTFGFDDFGTNELVAWSIDEAGNFSTCTAFVIVDTCLSDSQTFVCNDTMTVNVAPDGTPTFLYPLDVLVGGAYCPSNLGITVPPFYFNQPSIALDTSYVGLHPISVTHLISGAGCWGQLNVVAIDCITDVTPPTAICTTGQSFYLDSNTGEYQLSAGNLNAGSYDICGGNLQFRMELAPASALPPTTTSIVFDGDNIGFNNVVLWVIDQAGNADYCETNIFISDCPSNPNLACSDSIAVQLLQNQPTYLYPDALLAGGPYCLEEMNIRFIGPQYSYSDFLTLNASHVGIQNVQVTHLPSGNSCWGTINVLSQCATDDVPPTPVCVNYTVASLSSHGPNLTIIHAADLDNASYDNCSAVHFAVEMGAAPSSSFPSSATVSFTAVGVYDVYLWVADENGNAQFCSVTVEIIPPKCTPDVTAPIVTAPADHVYSSHDFEQFVFDLNDNTSLDAVFGAATAFDACGTVILSQSNNVELDNCNRISKITRNFVAWDEAGNSSAIKSQVIEVEFKYLISLPADHLYNDPGQPEELTFINLDPTTIIAVNHDDLTYDFNQDGIIDRIDRQWNIINWCKVDLQQPFPVLPRLDINNDGIAGDAYDGKVWLDIVTYGGGTITGSVPNNGSLQYNQQIYLTNVPCLNDLTPPVAVCNANTVVQLSSSGPNLTILNAAIFDQGSYDNCSAVNFAVEMGASPSATMPTTTTIAFTAEGVYENVYMWVADASGNANFCNITVQVDPPKCNPDNISPYFSYVPLDSTIHADDLAALNLDPQDYQQLNLYFGSVEVWDYCGVMGVQQAVDLVLNNCGDLISLTRNFMAIDLSGNTAFASQTITITNDFSFNLPSDFFPGDSGDPDTLSFVQGNGTLLATSYNDEVFDYNCDNQPDLIHRTWSLLNWCSGDPSGSSTDLPRLDLDNDGSMGDGYTAWDNEGQVFRLENGFPVQDLGAGNGYYTYTQIIRYNYNDTIQLNLTGIVFRDTDAGCDLDAGEPLLGNWKVKALGNNSGRYYHATTNASGIYVFDDICASDSELEISLDVSLNYGQTCPTTWTVALAQGIVAEQNIPVQLDTDCALMEVSLATPYLRRCFANNYTVSYCNYSASLIEDTWVEVSLDSFMAYNSSSIPGTLLSGNTYSFATGDLAAGQCENFTINFDLSCEAELGQTHCTEAHIQPDTLCPQNASWTGANIEVQGRCENEQVILTIRNTGSGAMAGPQEYIVVEDVLMFDNGNFNLGAGQSMQLAPIPANGATWRLEAEQAPAHPYPGNVSISLEGCDGINELGLVNLFPVENPNPFIAVDCQENQGSFDPNDKQAVPVGYGDDHFIYRNTDIEYLIRFQNTGTDTAFTVVVEDALSQYLDPTSIRPGASSHAYSYDLKDGNTVRFTFENILLPDSSENLAGSQGFVKFLAKQKPNLALGSVIENTAAIYFDFNEPITTNRVFHTIGEDFIEVINSASETANVHGQPTVYPNPAFGAVTFALPIELGGNAHFTMHDQLGNLAHRQAVTGNKFVFERKGMTPGIYFYSIENEGVVLFTGKVILK